MNSSTSDPFDELYAPPVADRVKVPSRSKKAKAANKSLQYYTKKKDDATKKQQEAQDDLKRKQDKISNHPGKDVDLTPTFIKPAAEEMGIVDEAATGSCGTTKLKNDKKKLSHTSKNALKWQGEEDLTTAQVAKISNQCVRKGTNAEWAGVIRESKGMKVSSNSNKLVCVATSECRAAQYQAQENKPRNGEECRWDIVLPQVNYSSDGDNIGMELLDEHGKKVTEEMYQQNNKLAKTVWVPDPDRMEELFDLLNKAGDDGKKKWKLGKGQKKYKVMSQKLTVKSNAMCFKGERWYDGKVLVCGPRDERMKTAAYRLTIHEDSNVECFAPYDDLALNAKSTPKKKAAKKK